MNSTRKIHWEYARLKGNAAGLPRRDLEQLADEALVRHAAVAMTTKLAAARRKGRGGWWRAEECTTQRLHELLVQHLTKPRVDMRDVLNLAAMIFVREQLDEHR